MSIKIELSTNDDHSQEDLLKAIDELREQVAAGVLEEEAETEVPPVSFTPGHVYELDFDGDGKATARFLVTDEEDEDGDPKIVILHDVASAILPQSPGSLDAIVPSHFDRDEIKDLGPFADAYLARSAVKDMGAAVFKVLRAGARALGHDNCFIRIWDDGSGRVSPGGSGSSGGVHPDLSDLRWSAGENPKGTPRERLSDFFRLADSIEEPAEEQVTLEPEPEPEEPEPESDTHAAAPGDVVRGPDGSVLLVTAEGNVLLYPGAPAVGAILDNAWIRFGLKCGKMERIGTASDLITELSDVGHALRLIATGDVSDDVKEAVSGIDFGIL